MGLFSGVGSALGFGSGGVSAAGKGMRESYFNPYNISGSFGSISSTPGYVPTKKEWKRGMRPTPGSFTANLSPEMQLLRDTFQNMAQGQLGQLGQGVEGFAGITPEMYQEFLNSDTGIGQDFLNASRGYMDEEQALGPYDFEQTYADRLANMRALDAPLEDRMRYQNWDNQFGKGILDSTGGSYQTEGVERGFAAKDIMRHDSAFGQALGLGDQYQRIRQMLQSAGLGFGQAGASDVSQRFQRALDMFGTGQQAESLGAQRAQGFLGGAAGIDQFLANLMQMGGNLGAQRSGANANAYAPYIQSKMAQDSMGFDFLGQLMGSIPGMSGFAPSGGS